MADLIITGASRGIGRAVALAVAAEGPLRGRLLLTARDATKLDDVARQCEASGAAALALPGDLASLAGAEELGERVAAAARAPATLVHNAGIWPAKRELTVDGLESAFVVNYVGPLLLQKALLDRQLVGRILVVSAGLLVKGRFSAAATPTGLDFSSWRTYCTTKLAFAIAEREMAARYPTVDFVVLHPGVVRTDLGARPGPLGHLLRWAKRSWEAPEVCAARLRGVLERERWSPPGEARWLMEDREQPWPEAAENRETRRAVRETMNRFLAESGGGAG